MEKLQVVTWKATIAETKLIEAIRRKTDAKNATAVQRAALHHYAKYNGVGDCE